MSVKLKMECGFINDNVPLYFNRKPVYVCLLTERSDGYLIDFRRIRYVVLQQPPGFRSRRLALKSLTMDKMS